MDGYYNSWQNAIKTRGFRRVGILVAALAVSGIFLIALIHWGPEGSIPSSWGLGGTTETDDGTIVDTPPEPAPESPASPQSPQSPPSPPEPPVLHKTDGRVDLCSPEQVADLSVFEQTRAKYDHLKDDKFTIAMQTYKRPDELHRTLDSLLEEPIPSLEEVVIVWNDLEENPPANYKSKHGVSVNYRMSARNSLNSRLQPKAEYKTQAILLTDDDVYYHPSDLEFVFQAWRKFGRDRLTGALPRCSTIDGETKQWKYGFCSKSDDNYAMVLTNLAFSHIAFMDYYSSDDPIMTKIRNYVDDGFNCEDIAMNFVTAWLTRQGPLQVTGHEQYINYEPAQGISRKPGHLEARSKCLNDFAEMFNCMPLVNETAEVHRGVHQL